MGVGHADRAVDVVSAPSTLRVVVDRDLCEGNARCVKVAPAVFRVDDEDRLEILLEAPPPELRDAVEQAIAVCPRQALRLVDAT